MTNTLQMIPSPRRCEALSTGGSALLRLAHKPTQNAASALMAHADQLGRRMRTPAEPLQLLALCERFVWSVQPEAGPYGEFRPTIRKLS